MKGVIVMKRTRWTSRLLIILVAALTLILAGDVFAGENGDKKDKKDKKEKKGKNGEVIRKDNERTGSVTDPTRAKKSSRELKSSRKGKGGTGNSTKSQTRTRSRQKSQKRSRKRSGGGGK